MTDRSLNPKPRLVALPWMIRLLALVALSLSCYLAWRSFTGGGMAGCGPMSDCDEVLASDWSKWLGMPVSVPGAAVYLSILLASFVTAPSAAARLQRRGWTMLTVLGVLAAGGAIWFTALQIGAIHHYCPYCLGVHGCGLIIAVLIAVKVMSLPSKRYDSDHRVMAGIRPGKLWALVLIGAGGLTALIAGQLLAAPPQRVLVTIGSPDSHSQPANTTNPATRIVTSPWSPTPDSALPKGIEVSSLPVFKLGKADIELDPREFPVLGSPNARVFLALMGDYTCPNCRSFHPIITRIRERYGAQLAIIVLPVPLESKCNPRILVTKPEHVNACELAQIALTVCRADPAAFDKMDHWLFSSSSSRTPQEARDYATQLVGAAAMKRALADPWVGRTLRQTVAMYARGGGGSIPKLLFPSGVDVEIHKEADLIRLLESELKLRPVGAAATAPSTGPTTRSATQPATARTIGASTAPATIQGNSR